MNLTDYKSLCFPGNSLLPLQSVFDTFVGLSGTVTKPLLDKIFSRVAWGTFKDTFNVIIPVFLRLITHFKDSSLCFTIKRNSLHDLNLTLTKLTILSRELPELN